MTTAELLKAIRRVEVRTNRLVNDTPVGMSDIKPIEFDGIGNCGEFATIKSQADGAPPVLIPSNSTELESRPVTVSHI